MTFAGDAEEVLAQLKTTAKNLMRGRIREVRAAEVGFAALNLPLLARQVVRYGFQHRAYVPPDASIFLRVHCEQEPTSRSSITLTDNRDSLGLLRTRLDWRISERELATIREYLQVATKSLDGTGTDRSG